MYYETRTVIKRTAAIRNEYCYEIPHPRSQKDNTPLHRQSLCCSKPYQPCRAFRKKRPAILKKKARLANQLNSQPIPVSGDISGKFIWQWSLRATRIRSGYWGTQYKRTKHDTAYQTSNEDVPYVSDCSISESSVENGTANLKPKKATIHLKSSPTELWGTILRVAPA